MISGVQQRRLKRKDEKSVVVVHWKSDCDLGAKINKVGGLG